MIDLIEPPLYASLSPVPGAIVEPVTVSLARTWLKRGDTSEDTTIGALITAARQQVEHDTNRHLPTQQWDVTFDAVPIARRFLDLRVSPLQSVVSVKTYDVANVVSVWAAENYYVDTAVQPGRLYLNAEKNWPANLREHAAMVVRVTSGYVATAIAVAIITRMDDVATVVTPAPHGLSTGEVVTVAAADQAEYNKTTDITVLSATSFSYKVSGAPATPATGAAITVTPTGVPASLTLAMRLLLAHWSEHREGLPELPLSYLQIVGTWQVVRLA